jgi:hypothetical protein
MKQQLQSVLAVRSPDSRVSDHRLALPKVKVGISIVDDSKKALRQALAVLELHSPPTQTAVILRDDITRL